MQASDPRTWTAIRLAAILIAVASLSRFVAAVTSKTFPGDAMVPLVAELVLAWFVARRLRIAWSVYVSLSVLALAALLVSVVMAWSTWADLLRHPGRPEIVEIVGLASWIAAFGILVWPANARRFTGRLRIIHVERAEGTYIW